MKKWSLKPDDKDLVVMWHKFNYIDRLSGEEKILTSSMGITGENQIQTAMAKTVGLPLGIAAKLRLTGQLPLIGLYIPTIREIYEPVLAELRRHGILFREKSVLP